jgi:integrase
LNVCHRPAPSVKVELFPARANQLLAFALLTGARDSAIASMKLRHIDLIENSVHRDAREVKTKKTARRLRPTSFLWETESGRLWQSGSDFYGKGSCGAMMIRCSQQRGSRWERLASLKQGLGTAALEQRRTYPDDLP